MSYKPQFTLTMPLLAKVEQISALRERILSAAVGAAWIPAVQTDARVRNAHSSTAIEGNPLTLEQVRAVEEGREVPAIADRSRLEVVNYLAGLRFIEKNAKKDVIKKKDILELHRIVASDVMDQGESGRYRSMRVRVGSYIAPRPEEVAVLMGELLKWWNTEASELSPILSSAIVHYQFEAIHPFADGNGRTGRTLALWELYRRGFDTHHVFSVDEFYWEDRPRYYEALQAVRRQEEDLTSWLEYTAEGLEFCLQRVWARVQKTRDIGDIPRCSVEVCPRTFARVPVVFDSTRLILRPRQEQLLQILSDRGRLTPREIWDTLGISRQGAMDLLNPLLKAGLVVREGTRKSGYYRLA